MIVTIASHHFVVTGVGPRERPAITAFSKGLVLQPFRAPSKYGDPSKQPKGKAFVASTARRDEFRYHINHLEAFKKHLRKFYITEEMVTWKHRQIAEVVQMQFPRKDMREDRPTQIPVMEYITSPSTAKSMLVELQTGQGKTRMALRSMEMFKMRTTIIIKPGYIDQWVREIKSFFDIRDSEICTIYGTGSTAQLISLLNMAADGPLPYKVILISNKTYQDWLKTYEEHQEQSLDMGYACYPFELMEHLDSGFRIIDEVHQDFHLNFKCDLYTHTWKSLSLSATLINSNQFINKMYEVAYPKNERCPVAEYIRYVHAYALKYRFRRPEKIKTSISGSTTYSHHAFEQSVLADPQVLRNYLDMVHSTVENTFTKNWKRGYKCLLYFASIEMCTVVHAHLKNIYGHLDVRRYVENDPYSNTEEAEMLISTLGSAGTAIDIPGLITALLFVHVNSTSSNLQGFGRIRNRTDGAMLEFVYVVATDFVKPIDYHETKKELLRTRALTYAIRHYSTLL